MKTELIWEQQVGKGLEHLILQRDKNIEIDSLAIGIIEDAAYRIKYHIVCDIDWRVEIARVEDLLNNDTLDLKKGTDGNWSDEKGKPVEALKGSTDVDIRITPFTNTLPIRRLKLALHESKIISVVYIRVPGLSISRVEQRYTLLSQEKGQAVYKYESLDSGFTSDLKVDKDGLVIDYPGIFKLVWKQEN